MKEVVFWSLLKQSVAGPGGAGSGGQETGGCWGSVWATLRQEGKAEALSAAQKRVCVYTCVCVHVCMCVLPHVPRLVPWSDPGKEMRLSCNQIALVLAPGLGSSLSFGTGEGQGRPEKGLGGPGCSPVGL